MQKRINELFDDCECIEDVKETYRKWALRLHPDMGGKMESMIILTDAYNVAAERWQYTHRSHNDKFEAEFYQTETPDNTDEYAEIIDKLCRIKGIEIELCGAWLWISGDTRPVKEELKAAGCQWSPKKSMWSWKPADAKRKTYRGKRTIEEIRNIYGSEKVKPKEREALA